MLAVPPRVWVREGPEWGVGTGGPRVGCEDGRNLHAQTLGSRRGSWELQEGRRLECAL